MPAKQKQNPLLTNVVSKLSATDARRLAELTELKGQSQSEFVRDIILMSLNFYDQIKAVSK